jgi:hypothetical protein
MFRKKVVLSIIAGAIAMSLSAFSQAANPPHKNETRVQTAVSAVNSEFVLATDRPRGFQFPSSRALKGLWVPILTSSLAGFLYVRLSHRSAYPTGRAPHQTLLGTNYSAAGKSVSLRSRALTMRRA